MIELIKKAMFTGIGVASLTKDKVEEIARDFVEQGRMSEAEGKKLVEEIMARSKESQEELTKKVDRAVQAALEKLDLAKASDIAALQAQINDLQNKIDTSKKA